MDKLNRAFAFGMKVLLKTAECIPYDAPAKKAEIKKETFLSGYPFVFVSGFWSWGQYKKAYKALPYWGFFTGESYIKSFTESGVPFAAADVSPMGSAWDRACELYAQLTGTVVDYGAAHAEKYHHPRFGEDYTGRALLKEWDGIHKLNIICHSFGGPTSALFATLLDGGSEEERKTTADGSISPLFTGGKGDWLHSITGIAGAYNGTTLITAKQAIEDTVVYLRKYFPLYKFDPFCKGAEKLAGFFEELTDGKTPDPDTGLFDMVPDNSVQLNKSIRAVKNVYYFTVPCCTTKASFKKNCHVPDGKVTDYFFMLLADILGRVNTTTPGGMRLGKDWQPNDGLVNTISEYGPLQEEKTFLHTCPSRKIAAYKLEKGHYYVFETYSGSHNDLCGGTIRPNKKAKDYLIGLIEMINSLE